MVGMPDLRSTVTLLNVGLGAVGLSLGLAPLIGFTVPAMVAYVGWIMVGVAGLLFLFGRKRLF